VASATPAEPSPHPRHALLRHLRSRRVAVVAIAVVLLTGVAGWQWWERGPSEVSVEDALDRFRSSSSQPATPSALLPAVGVYRYLGLGSEALSFLDTHQAQGPTIPVTVASGTGDCRWITVEYNSFHRMISRWCVEGRRVVERESETIQRFDFLAFSHSEHMTFTCVRPPVVYDPDARPGTSWPLHCTGRSRTRDTRVSHDGSVTFVGRQTLTIGGKEITALHFRQTRQMHGDQRGNETRDVWVSADRALVLRDTREIRVVSPAPSPIGNVTYTESGTYTLSSLAPQG
jgi:hypothetical protein